MRVIWPFKQYQVIYFEHSKRFWTASNFFQTNFYKGWSAIIGNSWFYTFWHQQVTLEFQNCLIFVGLGYSSSIHLGKETCHTSNQKHTVPIQFHASNQRPKNKNNPRLKTLIDTLKTQFCNKWNNINKICEYSLKNYRQEVLRKKYAHNLLKNTRKEYFVIRLRAVRKMAYIMQRCIAILKKNLDLVFPRSFFLKNILITWKQRTFVCV